MEAIVLAGGFGTRLAGVVKDVPKPMAPVANKPFLVYVLDDLIDQGIDRIILAVCHKKESIMDYFGNEYRKTEIVYSVEKTPLLTGGAIKKALELCKEERAFVINGDTFFEIEFRKIRSVSERTHSNISIALKEMSDFSRYGAVALNDEGEITAFCEKKFCAHGYINGGIYDIRKDVLADYPPSFSLENECFPHLLKEGKVVGVPFQGYFIDIGVPEDYEKAQTVFGRE